MSSKRAETTECNFRWREYLFKASPKLSLALFEKEFPEFLFPHPRVQTSGRKPNEPLLGVIARWQGQTVGLVLVEKTDSQNGLVICWNVIKSHRSYGLGKKLMIHMEQFAKSNALQSLSISFREDSSFQKQITKTLNSLQWKAPKKELMLYKFSPKLFMQMPWVQNMYLPTEIRIFSWSALTAEDKQYIINRQKQTNWYPEEQSPLFDIPDVEPANSVGLRLQGEVVGWLITHRVHSDVIEYSSLFVSPELQNLARGYHLIVEAVKRQYEHGITRGIFQVQTKNTAMISFVEKRAAETISAQTARCFSKKSLIK